MLSPIECCDSATRAAESGWKKSLTAPEADVPAEPESKY
jgi:hypothetical protein